jgi:DNA polymerase III subunit delta
VKTAETFEAGEMNVATAVSWLTKDAEARGGRMDRQKAQFLIERVGTNQSRLSHELDKLVVHPEITRQLIVDITEATPQATAFELLDAVLHRQVEKTQAMVSELQGAEDPYKLFGLFSSQVYTLAVVVTAGTKISSQQTAKDTGLHPYVIGKMSKVARRTSWKDVELMITQLADLDDKLKSSGADPWLLLETTLMKIAAR